MRILTVPGITGSGPEHWQTHWERADPRIERVEQRDWERPARAEWVATLDEAVRREDVPTILVAHSLGCTTVAHWAAVFATAPVTGALLVAPADVEEASLQDLAPDFLPLPQRRLPFRSVVLASSDDPYLSRERARLFASWWGSELHDVGAKGHLNSASGLGSWPEGWAYLQALART